MDQKSLPDIQKGSGVRPVQADASVPNTYRTIDEEYATARRYAAFFDLSHFGKLRLTGKDALDLLNRISTNDLNGMRPGMGRQTFLATEKGRVVDLCTVYVQQSSIVLLTSPENSDNVRKWISRFVITEDVKIEDVTGTFPMLFVGGSESADFIAHLVQPSHKQFLDIAKMPRYNFIRTFLGPHEVFLSRTNLTSGNGYLVLVHPGDKEELWNLLLENGKRLGAVPAGLETFEVMRIENGTPLYPHELNDDHNPWEVNLMDTISGKKGCYVGQEVIARLQTYDKVRKRLVGLVSESRVPRGAKVLDARGASAGAQQEIGVVTSSAKSPGTGKEVALAYVSVGQLVPGAKYSVNVGGRSVEAELSELPIIV